MPAIPLHTPHLAGSWPVVRSAFPSQPRQWHHGATGLAGGGPAARYRGTVRVHALQSIAQVLLVHDRVPPIDGLGLVAGDLHGDGPRNPGMLNVPDGGSPQIVEEAARHLRLLARPTPRAAGLLDALTPAWNTWATRAYIAPPPDRQGESLHTRPGKPWDCHRPRRARGVARVALWYCPDTRPSREAPRARLPRVDDDPSTCSSAYTFSGADGHGANAGGSNPDRGDGRRPRTQRASLHLFDRRAQSSSVLRSFALNHNSGSVDPFDAWSFSFLLEQRA